MGQVLSAQPTTEQSVCVTEHLRVLGLQVLTAQSAVVEHSAAALSEQKALPHVPGAQSLSATQFLTVQPATIGVLHTLVRTAHFFGAVSGIAPQQSALAEHS